MLCITPSDPSLNYVLGGKDYFCLKENVVDGDRASTTSAKWLSRASF